MSLKARKTDVNDCHELAPKLRQADVDEIRANSGKTPLEALLEGYAVSCPCVTIETDEHNPVVVGMFGVAPADGEGKVGVVWMLASDELKKHGRYFLRQSHDWIAKLHKKYPVLWNYVDKRNRTHIGWLKWLGANFVGESVRGVEQRPFCEFILV